MNPQRRTAVVACLSAMLAPRWSGAQNQPVPGASVVDSVALYVLPTDGVAEQTVAQVAQALSRDTGLWVKASPGPLAPLPGGQQVAGEVVGARVQKMLMRIVGEMRLGWQRTSDPADLMYAPILSVDDIDAMDVAYTVRNRQLVRP